MKFLVKGNMNIEECMKEYVPVTQTYFDVTEDYLIFCKSGASLDRREVGEAIGAATTWFNVHNIPLDLLPGTYCLEQPGNKLRKLED